MQKFCNHLLITLVYSIEMANISISDLDPLPGGYLSTDLVVVQRDTQAYKLPISDLSSAVNAASRYVDQASISISAHNLSEFKSGKRISFRKNGLLNQGSSFVIQMNFDNGGMALVKNVNTSEINGVGGLIPSNRPYQILFKTLSGDVYADIIIDSASDSVSFENIYVKSGVTTSYQASSIADSLNTSSLRSSDTQLSASNIASIVS
jgi:hypothetical protein